MAQAKFFNKGTLRGIVAKSELIEFDGSNGKDKFLAVEVNTGGTNKVKSTFFNTKANPSKCKELHEQFPTNSKVQVSGKIGERAYDSNGKKGIDRSIGGLSMGIKKDGDNDGAFFIYQGTVTKIAETSDGVNITVRYEETYTPNGKTEPVTKEEFITLSGDSDAVQLVSDVDLAVGCNAKFKGVILNQLEVDDYGDITGSVSMFSVQKIEDVIQKDELSAGEDLSFL